MTEKIRENKKFERFLEEKEKYIEEKSRNKQFFLYGIYLRDMYDITNEEDLFNEILIAQKVTKGFEEKEKKIYNETKATAKSILKKENNKYLYEYCFYFKYFITKQNLLDLNKIKEKPLKRLYLALIIQANSFQKSYKDGFYMTYKQMNYLMQSNIKEVKLKEYLIALENKYKDSIGFEIKSMGVLNENGSRYLPNFYSFSDDKIKTKKDDKIYFLEHQYLNVEDIYKKAIHELLTKKEIEKIGGKKQLLPKNTLKKA